EADSGSHVVPVRLIDLSAGIRRVRPDKFHSRVVPLARSEGPVIGEAAAGIPEGGIPAADQGAGESVRFVRYAIELIPNAKIQTKRREDFPVILEECAPFALIPLTFFVITIVFDVPSEVRPLRIIQDESLTDGPDGSVEGDQKISRVGQVVADQA